MSDDMLESELFIAKARKVFGSDMVDVLLTFYREMKKRQEAPAPLQRDPELYTPFRPRTLVEEDRPIRIELTISRAGGTGFRVHAAAGSGSHSEYAYPAQAFVRQVHAEAFARRIGAAIERVSQQLADVIDDLADDYEYRQILENQGQKVPKE
jgi:hypothetical protein